MALDLIKIYMNGLNSKTNQQLNCSMKDAIFLNGLKGFQYKENNESPNLAYYFTNIDGINIKYLPYYNKGELRIKFNIPKLMAGTNVCSIFLCNTQQLFQRLCFKLRPLIDLSKAPHLRYWKVASFESNIDIIMDKRKIDAIYSVLKKTSSTARYKQVSVYDTGGKTIYFIPQKAKYESTDIVIKAYYKLHEMKEKDDEFNVQELYSSCGIVNLNPGYDILRIEITKKRDAIYQDFKPNIIAIGSSNGILTDAKDLISFKNIGTFEQVINLDYQYNVLRKMIEGLNLNKNITTPKNIQRLINDSDKIPPNRKKLFLSTTQYNNTIKSHKKKPADAVTNECNKFILSEGYNYLYADTEIDAISIPNIIGNLPIVQQIEVALYKNSSIYKDVQLSTLPNPRIYKGIHY